MQIFNPTIKTRLHSNSKWLCVRSKTKFFPYFSNQLLGLCTDLQTSSLIFWIIRDYKHNKTHNLWYALPSHKWVKDLQLYLVRPSSSKLLQYNLKILVWRVDNSFLTTKARSSCLLRGRVTLSNKISRTIIKMKSRYPRSSQGPAEESSTLPSKEPRASQTSLSSLSWSGSSLRVPEGLSTGESQRTERSGR